MKLLTVLFTVATLVMATGGPIGAADEPSVGDPAPAFNLIGSDGKMYSLDDFKDNQAIVLAWFPKAFTGG